MFERRRIVINRRSAVGLIVLFIATGIRQSQTAGSQVDLKSEQKNNTNNNHVAAIIVKSFNETNTNCPNDPELPCAHLLPDCLYCKYNTSCYYGRDVNVTCQVPEEVPCTGERTLQRQMNCRYCYQTEKWQQKCSQRGHCNSVNDQWYRTNCTVDPTVYCLGNRKFTRNIKCNWTQGYRWSSALVISLLLGGFGGDRFYLGHWQEGIGKLFSFGGLGVWTIIDVVLISLHYLGPADGSLYI